MSIKKHKKHGGEEDIKVDERDFEKENLNQRDKKKDYERCTLCGMCRVECPFFIIDKNEANSPRGKSILLKNDNLGEIFYKCTLCGACKKACPNDLDLSIKALRQKLVEKGITTKKNEEMIKKIRKYKNPFGSEDEEIKDLYCC